MNTAVYLAVAAFLLGLTWVAVTALRRNRPGPATVGSVDVAFLEPFDPTTDRPRIPLSLNEQHLWAGITQQYSATRNTTAGGNQP